MGGPHPANTEVTRGTGAIARGHPLIRETHSWASRGGMKFFVPFVRLQRGMARSEYENYEFRSSHASDFNPYPISRPVFQNVTSHSFYLQMA